MSNCRQFELFPITLLSLLCAVIAQASAHAQQGPQEFLYYAKVVVERATVHSGPGQMHYGTDELKRDSIVKVYRQDPGGWLAIQPPKGSFSLVMSSDIRIGEDNLGVVVNPGRAWVGTRLAATDKPMWQVQLKEGEILDVLGSVDRTRYELSEDEPDWVQVAPPSGEFRWIHQDTIERIQAPQPATTGNRPSIPAEWETTPSIERDQSPEPSQALPDIDGPMAKNESNDWSFDDASTQVVHNQGWKPAKRSISAIVGERSQYIADAPPASVDAINHSISPPTSFANHMTIVPSGEGDLASTIDHLDLLLTQEMLKEPPQWNLIGIEQQVQSISAGSLTPFDQSKIEKLLEKLQRCREIQAGVQAAESAPPVDVTTFNTLPSSPNPQLIGATATGAGVRLAGGTSELSNQYDAVGWLNELVRDGGTGPTSYVLQDETGKITYFVTPAPGVNLHRFLKQPVGIVGNRGFNRQMNLDHVTAERVISIKSFR